MLSRSRPLLLATPSRLALLFALLFTASSVPLVAPAQAPQSAKPPVGSIAGRITANDKPLAGVRVALMSGEGRWRESAVTRAVTDDDGRYRLAGVAPGRYRVTASAPLYVAPGTAGFGGEGKSITLDPGEDLTNTDFALVRGGVIAGRVTDAEGQPVVEEPITILPVDENNKRIERPFFFNPFDNATDDRGVYRIYGVPPGRYLVSAGHGGEGGMVRMGFGNAYFARTFHPDARDESEATVVEVTPGGEQTNIDIKLGRATRTYTATGRMIDADSGEPVVGVAYGYGTVGKNNQMGAFGFTNSRTNVRGEFRIEGLLPDRYALVLQPDASSAERYAETKNFEVRDGDVTGIEIKLHRASSISGVLSVEGAAPAAARARIAQLNIGADPVNPDNRSIRIFGDKTVNPDGTFRLGGLREGKHRLYLSPFPTPPKGFSILRIEQNNSPLPDNQVDVAAGASVSGVRVVLAYGEGRVRGRVQVQGGELPQGARLFVNVKRADSEQTNFAGITQVDANNRFLIEGLAAGTYELTLQGGVFGGSTPPLRFAPVKATVNVTGDGEAQTEMTIDITPRAEEEKKP